MLEISEVRHDPYESESEKNLSELGKMLVFYLADHEDRYPADLRQYQKECRQWTHGFNFEWMHQHVQYLGGGRFCKSMPPDIPIAYDKTMLIEKRETYVLFNAAYVRRVPQDKCVKLGLINRCESEDTRIETCGPMELMGVAIYGNPETTSFCRAWELFGEVADEASVSRVEKDIYGLQIYHPRFPRQFELTYMACLQREPGMDVPIRMIVKSLPESRYAVRRVVGGVAGIDEVLMYLYQDYIPNHGLRVAMPFDFEKYRNVRDQESCPDDIEIWVPIEDA